MRDVVIFVRFLRRNIALTAINLLGLSLGISSCIFISIFIIDEMSYDASNVKADRIYRLSSEIISEASVDHVPLTSAPLAEFVKKDFTGIEQAIRINAVGDEANIKVGERLLYQKGVFKADPEVFQVFTYPLLSGNPQSALSEPNQVVVTRSIASNYFGTTDVIGKLITVNKKDHLVSGVMEDVPPNSDLKFTMLISMDTTDQGEQWFNFDYTTYVLFDQQALRDTSFLRSFQKQLTALNDEKVNQVIRKENASFLINLHMQRVKGIHFDEPLLYDTPKGNIYYTYVFSAVAFLILLIGCLNFINFSIVQSIERSKEVGIRKVVGATFARLVRRYVGESFLFTFVALAVALLIVAVLMPVFNDLIDRQFTLLELMDYRILLAMLAILVLVGVLAGSYPAFYMSSVRPVEALKGKVSTPKGQLIRKISICAQFFISIGLIICTVVVYRQMSFIKNFSLGFRKDNLVAINVTGDSLNQSKINGFVGSLKQNPAVQSVVVAGYGGVPSGSENSAQRGTVTFKSNGKDEVRMTNATHIDENYIPTLGLRLVEGRNYDGSLSDFHNSILVNEAVVRMMGWKDPLQQQVVWNGTPRNIIGVIGDFHYMSLYNQVEPQVLPYHDNMIVSVLLRLRASDLKNDVARLEESFHNYYSDEPFVYRFLDESIRLQYQREDKAMTIFTYFSILTISISGLGLFGVSSLSVYQRKKEIGIRRIIGADYLSIIYMFSKEYLLLIGLSLLAVTPLAWYVMVNWLESFPYRQPISVIIFILSGTCVLTVAFLTVLFSLARMTSVQPVSLIRES